MSIEAVAAAAGVGKPTVYRRYRSKPELAAAAILAVTIPDEPALPEDPRAALVMLLQLAAESLVERGAMTMIGTLLAEEARDPELVRVFRERVFAPRHEVVRRVLRTAVERGAVASRADIEVVPDLLFGALLSRSVAGLPIAPEWAERAVDAVWPGLTTPGDR